METESKAIDSHQHFWVYNETDYAWMGPEHGVLRRDFLPDHLGPLQDESGFDGSIAVQARQMIEETRWLLDIADSSPMVRGVVGWVDLRSDRLPDQLEEFDGRSKLCGVRHIVHDEPDDEFVLGAEFRRGVSALASHNLTYDLLLFPRHLDPAIKLVSEFPNQPFVIDHIAKPNIAEGILSPWREDIAEIARRENVYCKLSGMVTEAGSGPWNYEMFVPFLDVILEAFGPDRCMIGSDWPVCTLAGGYSDVTNIVRRYTEKLMREERNKVLGDTCRRFYGV